MGEKIRNLRLNNNLSQDDLASIISCDREKVSRYENDKLKHPDFFFIIQLAEAFHVSTDYFR